MLQFLNWEFLGRLETAIAGFSLGLLGLIHHKWVSGVWLSTYQSWLRCHGRLSLLLMVLSLMRVIQVLLIRRARERP